jgi:threonine synthase
MRGELWSVSISDELTRATIRKAYDEHGALLEPHGAVGWAGLAAYLESHPGDDNLEQLCVSLETAHPAKFPEEIQHLLGVDPPLPPSLEGLDGKPEFIARLEPDYQAFKNYLLTSF